MLRLSVFLSVCFHILLLGIVSIILSQHTTRNLYTEKRFQVNLRKNVTMQATASSRQPDRTPLRSSARKLLQTQEFSLSQFTLQKAQQENMVEMQPFAPVSPHTLKAQVLPDQPSQNKTPAIQEFVVVAREFPTPIPTPAPTPALPESDFTPTSLPTSTGNTTATAKPLSHDKKAEVNSIKKREPKDAERSTEQQPKELLKHYLQEVAAKIHAMKRYPRRARRKGWEGTVVLKLSILSTGEVKHVALVKSSQHKVLDEAAFQTIEKAQPFPRFSEKLTLPSITVNIPIQFVLGK